MAKFKELPKKEQEGYVIAYTNAIKVKTYQLCYRDIGEALKKLKEDDEDALSIEAIIKRKDGSSSTEESIKASAKDVIPVIEALVKSGRYFSKNHDYQTLGDVVVKESQSLSMIPDDFITEELVDYAIESKKYLNVRDIPSKFMTARRFVTICKKDRSAVEKNTDVIDKLSEPDKKLFWNMVVKERLFTKPISVPSEYMSKEVICDWVKGKYCYDAKDIPKVYHTEDVLLELAKAHPDRFTYDYDIQTQKLIDTIMSLAEKDICKAIYLKKVRPDLRRKSLIDELCLTVPREMLSLDSISKEQIDVILSHSPDLIIDTPMWYIRELRSGKQNKDTGKPALEANNIPHMDVYTNAPIKKQIESPDIMIDDWTQISIFDILAAQ